MATIRIIISQLITIDATNTASPRLIRKHKCGNSISLHQSNSRLCCLNILMIALFKLLNSLTVIGNKIEWAAILTEQTIELIRCKMQLFEICTVPVVVNVDTKILQQFCLLGREVQILNQPISGALEIVTKGPHHRPLPIGTTEVMVNQYRSADIRGLIDHRLKCSGSGNSTSKMVIHIEYLSTHI